MLTPQSQNDASLAQVLGTFWTIPNALSLIRLVLVVPITYLILVGGSLVWLMGLVAAVVATDWLDGRLARWLHTVSAWGKVLDPLADKFAAAMIVMALVLRGGEAPTLPAWFLALIVTRDVLIVGGGAILARRTGHVVMSIWAGKAAVAMLSLTVLAALLRADAPVLEACVWMTTALLIYSFLRYLVRFVWMAYAGAPPEVGAPRTDRAARPSGKAPAPSDPPVPRNTEPRS